MKMFYAVGYMEVCLDSIGAKVDYIKYKSEDILKSFKICIPNYGVDKTFRFPEDGLFKNMNYEIISKSDDICVFKAEKDGLEIFVMYQFSRDSFLVHASFLNNSDADIKVNPAIAYKFQRDFNIINSNAILKLKSGKDFIIKNVNDISDNECVNFSKKGSKKTVLRIGEKIVIDSEIELI